MNYHPVLTLRLINIRLPKGVSWWRRFQIRRAVKHACKVLRCAARLEFESDEFYMNTNTGNPTAELVLERIVRECLPTHLRQMKKTLSDTANSKGVSPNWSENEKGGFVMANPWDPSEVLSTNESSPPK